MTGVGVVLCTGLYGWGHSRGEWIGVARRLVYVYIDSSHESDLDNFDGDGGECCGKVLVVEGLPEGFMN